MHRILAVSFAIILAACTAPDVPRSTGTPEKLPQPNAVVRDLPDVLPARAAVRNFLTVVEIVEPVAEAECRARAPAADCDFQIFVDDRPGLPPNAYQTLDNAGRPIIAFTVPLIAEMRNQDEIAFILAHEAAHHIAGHLTRQQQNANLGAVVFGQLAGVLGDSNPEAIEAAQQFGAALGARTYSKDFELEADELGTIITARAGFNPIRGADFFFRIPDPGNTFLGTHPANADRLAVVRQTAAQLGFQ